MHLGRMPWQRLTVWRQTDYPRFEVLPPYKPAELDEWKHVVSWQLSGEMWCLAAQFHNLKPYIYGQGRYLDQSHQGCQRANIRSDNQGYSTQSYHQDDGYMQSVEPNFNDVTAWKEQASVPVVGWHPLPRGEGWYLGVGSQHACEQRWPTNIGKVPEQTERCFEQPECQAEYVLMASRGLKSDYTSMLRTGDIQRHRGVPLQGSLGGTRFPEEGSIGDRGTVITVCGCPGSQ